MVAQITAVVPTFNRGHLLAETLDALLLQNRAVCQIIVWDDGSTDNTVDIVAPYLRDHGDVLEFMRGENGGKSFALNQALQRARGDYIWICDDDDIALPEATEKLGAVLDANPDVGLVAGRHLRFSTTGSSGTREISDTGYWPDLRSGSPLRHVLEDIFFFQNATLVRRECYEQVGPFAVDLARSIDYDMTVRLMVRFPSKVIPDTVFLQRKHDGARGPAWQRHTAASSEEVWRVADREIFDRLRKILPISIYEMMYESPDSDLRKRAALLQRGAVYARRQDWATAFQDFEAAVDVASDQPLTTTERQIAVRAVAAKHGTADLFKQTNLGKLRRFSEKSVAGRSLVSAISRGSVWRFRQALLAGRYREALAISTLLARMPPLRVKQSSENADQVIERDILPAEAFAW